MNGQTEIAHTKSAFMGRKRANEVADRLNIPWLVDLPDPQMGSAEFVGSDAEVRLDLSQIKVVRFIGCDPDTGEKFIFNCLGWSEPAPA